MTESMSTAFVSYSWDSDEHKKWVRELATRLREDGIDVTLDQWELAPGDQLTEFMERGIRDHSFVIVICTPKYRQRSDTREGGVGYEGDIITAEVMMRRNLRKFIPVWRSGTWEEAAPSWLAGKYRINLSGDTPSLHEYQDLIETLRSKRRKAPPVGERHLGARAGGSAAEASHKAPTPQFEDIYIVRVIVEDVTEPRDDGTRGSALYSVPFELSANPPHEWAALFRRHWDRPSRFTLMHRPGIASVRESRVVLEGTTIEEVRDVHRGTLILAVQAANREYRERVLQEQQNQRDQAAQRERHRANVEDIARDMTFE